MNDLDLLELELRALLVEADVPTQGNRLTPGEVRTLLKEFLAFLEEEFARFPAERNESHWTLVMNDADPGVESTFILFVVSPGKVQLAAGRGLPHTVRSISERYEGGAAEAVEKIGGAFTLASKRCDFPKRLIEAWVAGG